MEEQEKQQLIYEITERILLRMPEVMGNLMQEHAAIHEMSTKFYEANPEFKDHRLLAVAVISEVEKDNPSDEYAEILAKATPIIRERIRQTKACKELALDEPKARNCSVLPGSNGAI